MFSRFFKTIIAGWMLALFVVLPLTTPQVARAQLVTVDIQASLDRVADSIREFIRNTMQAAIVTTVVNTMQFAANRLAYDAAVRIATGGNGGEPLFDKRTSEEYFVDYGKAVAGEAIGLLSDEIKGAGGLLSNFNLCAPSSPYILLQFKLGIKSAFERPKPKCDFNKMFGPEGEWVSFMASLDGEDAATRNQAIIKELANMYDPQVNEISAGIALYTDIFGDANSPLGVIKTLEQSQNNGFKAITNVVTGQVETPAQWLEEEVRGAQEEAGNTTEQATYAMLGNQNLMLSLGTYTASVFTNTLLSKLQERIWTGMFDYDQQTADPFNPESFALPSSEDAAEHYRSLLAVAPLEVPNYSILSEFVTCPGSEDRGLYNCVADSSFISAVARADAGAALTVGEAVEEGLLDGSWPLIPSSDVARNQDAFCYTYGYCYGNLVKLRKARVISLGWELAANSEFNTPESPVTLQEVLDGFTICNNEGLPDVNHPWCGMIDPDWVLKYPDTQCRMQAYGELLLSDQAQDRAQTCVDMPSCIEEDENGNCIGGYGYCVAEENTWKFRGQSCPEYAASCLSFTDSSGDSLNLLKNTLDPGACTEGSVGCRWYFTQKEEQADGSFAYGSVSSVADADSAEGTYTQRKYFTGEAASCDDSAGGCSTLYVRTSDDIRLNAVMNGGFEDDVDANAFPDGWYENHFSRGVLPSTYSTDGSSSRSGEAAVVPGARASAKSGIYQPGIALYPNRSYTLSFYARQRTTAGSDAASVVLDVKDEQGNGVDLYGMAITGDCDGTYEDVYGNTVSTGIGIEAVTPESPSYERFTCSFALPDIASNVLYGDLFIFAFNGFIDDVQLEQAENASLWAEDYSKTPSTIVAKVPPTYLGCTGSDEDPEECNAYAQVCTASEVGCTAYTPTNGDPTVTGTANALDVCPAACSGYDTYRQEATRYEPDGVPTVYMTAETAETCSIEDVGCDEFTNIGTEEREYFTYLRACLTEDQAATNPASSGKASTFYTWEGSDESGYQLRTWRLLESNASPTPYTHVGSDGVTDAYPGKAPCSLVRSVADSLFCEDMRDEDRDGVRDWDTEACNSRDDIFTNPSCREFYDADGGTHYRLWENTVTIDDSCASYRKTEVAGDTQEERSKTCSVSGGYFDENTGECRYFGIASESSTCDESVNGCRAYAGGRSRNSRLVFEEFFEDGVLSAWDAPTAKGVTLSNESLAADGHAVEIQKTLSTFLGDNGSTCADANGCEAQGVSLGGTCTVEEGKTTCGTLDDELYQGKMYTVSFLVKGTGTLSIGFDVSADPKLPKIDLPFGDVTMGTSWQQVTLGPVLLDPESYPRAGEGTTLMFSVNGGVAYVDSVVLREGEDGVYVLRDSWSVPAECDEDPSGNPSPQYYLGCQEYTTQSGDVAYVKSFSSLCSEKAVGCAAFYSTEETDTTVATTYQATCENLDLLDAQGNGIPDSLPDTATSPTSCYYFASATGFDTTSDYLCTIGVGKTSCQFTKLGFTPEWNLPDHLSYTPETVVVPADAPVYLAVTSEDLCSSGEAGCTEFGSPAWSADRNSIEGGESVYLLDLPETYETTLCAHEELFCDALSTDQGDTFYMKNPLGQTCEYRSDVTIDGVLYTGWFRSGTDEFCYGTCEDASGNEGDACGSSADCASGEMCDATNPSYLIAGESSGIWSNGDAQYRGWAGTCASSYDACTEFQDPLAEDDGILYSQTSGDSFFYINDDTLSDYALSDSQKCNGQVSLKEGCALFNDTGVSAHTANASATEIASRRSDVLFGTAAYALVDPIDCDAGDGNVTLADGTAIDLCEHRCTYDLGEINDLTDGTTYREKLLEEAQGSASYDRDDLYAFGGSCVDVTDCATVSSESGRRVSATSCTAQVREGQQGAGYTETPRLENDTNTVMKVNRDRACAEWLSCSSTQTQWDAEQGKFITSCNDIALCKEYDPANGSTFCSDWDFEQPEVVYDAEWYAGRDTSWYGNDYSGMAIPDMFPVQSLTQADVSPAGYCNGLINGEVRTCEDASGCPNGYSCISPDEAITEGLIESKDYALVLDAGFCSETDYGAACAVGYCENSGAACSTDSQCNGSSCVVGSCYKVGMALCQTSDDCSEGQVCYGGSCATVGDTVVVDDYDAQTGTSSTCTSVNQLFVPHVDLKVGSCINSACLLTPSGEPYLNGATEGKICRAYPDAGSPFTNDVVTAWYSPSNPGVVLRDDDVREDALPYDLVSGFENVATCSPEENCDCSYTKVTFGTSGNDRYFRKEWSSGEVSLCAGTLEENPLAGSVCLDSGDCGKDEQGEPFACEILSGGSGSAIGLGTCSSGPRLGGFCSSDDQCSTDGTASCTKATREDVFYGLQGFCLEKDSSINIHGDRNKQACLSWLPVDELAGDTDLQAKYTEAGYFDDTYVCADVAPYIALGPSRIPEQDGSYNAGEIACAKAAGAVGSGVDYSEIWTSDHLTEVACAENAICPDGYWSLVGMPSWKLSKDIGYFADSCLESINRCPYMCIPYGAQALDGRSCDPTDTSGVTQEYLTTNDTHFSWTQYLDDAGIENAFIIGKNLGDSGDPDLEGYALFDNLAVTLSSCAIPGVEYTDSIVNEILDFDTQASPNGIYDFSNPDYEYLEFMKTVSENAPYLNVSCKDVLQVASSQDYSGYAFTDRLLNTNSSFDELENTVSDNMRYDREVSPDQFGLIITDPTTRNDVRSPLQVAGCQENLYPETSWHSLVPPAFGSFNACGNNQKNPDFVQEMLPEDALARSFVDYRLGAIDQAGNPSVRSGLAQIWQKNPYSDEDPLESSMSLINQLFASAVIPNEKALFSWESTWNGDAGYVADYGDESAYEPYDVRAEVGRAPTVWSVDLASCSDDGIMCEEGTKNRITVNSQDTGTQTGIGFFNATVKFYAAADKNQLPLRRVIVDWGDNVGGGNFSGSSDDENFFKNARGLQEGSQNSKCDLGTEWGLTPESCDPYYFTYGHIYTCSSEVLLSADHCEDANGDGVYDASPCTMDQNGDAIDESCAFVPRVHVRDNWGWCTGVCTLGNDASDGCFDGDGLVGLASAATLDECGSYHEDIYEDLGNIPYASYDGLIIVTP